MWGRGPAQRKKSYKKKYLGWQLVVVGEGGDPRGEEEWGGGGEGV